MFRMNNKLILYFGVTGIILGLVVMLMIVFSRATPVGENIIQMNESMEQLLNQQSDLKSAPIASNKPASTIIPQSTPGPASNPTTVSPHPVSTPAASSNLESDKIDLNTATVEQLDELPGVGPSKAKEIIKYREKNSGFESIEDLQNVKGIGPKIFEKLRPYIYVSKSSS